MKIQSVIQNALYQVVFKNRARRQGTHTRAKRDEGEAPSSFARGGGDASPINSDARRGRRQPYMNEDNLVLIFCTLFFLVFFTSSPSFGATTITYTYDNLNRLETVNYSNGYPEIYGCDSVGNRTSLDIGDLVPPESPTITSDHLTLSDGLVTLSGTASDLGSGVEKVQISLDGGVTWQDATGTTSWSYSWAATPGTYNISVRVTDKKGNVSETSYTITIFTQLYGDFGANNGIWMYNGTTWAQFTPSDPEAMIASGSLLYGDFGSGGIWMYNGTTWAQFTPSDPETMVVSGSLLYGDFSSYGIWQWDGTTWAQFTPSDPEAMIASDG